MDSLEWKMKFDYLGCSGGIRVDDVLQKLTTNLNFRFEAESDLLKLLVSFEFASKRNFKNKCFHPF